jgi:hypothetical protein
MMMPDMEMSDAAMMLVPMLRMARRAFGLRRVESRHADHGGEKQEQGVFHWWFEWCFTSTVLA